MFFICRFANEAFCVRPRFHNSHLRDKQNNSICCYKDIIFKATVLLEVCYIAHTYWCSLYVVPFEWPIQLSRLTLCPDGERVELPVLHALSVHFVAMADRWLVGDVCTCICTPLVASPFAAHQPPNPTSGVGDVKTHCDISRCPASRPLPPRRRRAF